MIKVCDKDQFQDFFGQIVGYLQDSTEETIKELEEAAQTFYSQSDLNERVDLIGQLSIRNELSLEVFKSMLEVSYPLLGVKGAAQKFVGSANETDVFALLFKCHKKAMILFSKFKWNMHDHQKGYSKFSGLNFEIVRCRTTLDFGNKTILAFDAYTQKPLVNQFTPSAQLTDGFDFRLGPIVVRGHEKMESVTQTVFDQTINSLQNLVGYENEHKLLTRQFKSQLAKIAQKSAQALKSFDSQCDHSSVLNKLSHEKDPKEALSLLNQLQPDPSVNISNSLKDLKTIMHSMLTVKQRLEREEFLLNQLERARDDFYTEKNTLTKILTPQYNFPSSAHFYTARIISDEMISSKEELEMALKDVLNQLLKATLKQIQKQDKCISLELVNLLYDSYIITGADSRINQCFEEINECFVVMNSHLNLANRISVKFNHSQQLIDEVKRVIRDKFRSFNLLSYIPHDNDDTSIEKLIEEMDVLDDILKQQKQICFIDGKTHVIDAQYAQLRRSFDQQMFLILSLLDDYVELFEKISSQTVCYGPQLSNSSYKFGEIHFDTYFSLAEEALTKINKWFEENGMPNNIKNPIDEMLQQIQNQHPIKDISDIKKIYDNLVQKIPPLQKDNQLLTLLVESGTRLNHSDVQELGVHLDQFYKVDRLSNAFLKHLLTSISQLEKGDWGTVKSPFSQGSYNAVMNDNKDCAWASANSIENLVGDLNEINTFLNHISQRKEQVQREFQDISCLLQFKKLQKGTQIVFDLIENNTSDLKTAVEKDLEEVEKFINSHQFIWMQVKSQSHTLKAPDGEIVELSMGITENDKIARIKAIKKKYLEQRKGLNQALEVIELLPENIDVGPLRIDIASANSGKLHQLKRTKDQITKFQMVFEKAFFLQITEKIKQEVEATIAMNGHKSIAQCIEALLPQVIRTSYVNDYGKILTSYRSPTSLKSELLDHTKDETHIVING